MCYCQDHNELVLRKQFSTQTYFLHFYHFLSLFLLPTNVIVSGTKSQGKTLGFCDKSSDFT